MTASEVPEILVTWRDALPPGIGHVRRGRSRGAIKFVVVLAVWVAIVVFRWSAVARALSFESAAAVIAVATLVALPLALVWWARLDLYLTLNPATAVSGASQTRLSYERLVKNPQARAGLWCLGLLYLVALLRPVLAPYDPNRQPDDAIANQYRPPFSSVYVFAKDGVKEMFTQEFAVEGDALLLRRDLKRPQFDRTVPIASLGRPKNDWSLPGEKTIRLGEMEVPYREEFHALGTDESGRDLLSRLIYGSGISLWIGFVAMAIAITIGTFVGALAGYLGGWVDTILMRFVDVLLAFPLLLLLLLVVSLVRTPSIWLVVMILGATGWMGVSRLVRGQFLTLKELDFTTAARALGVSSRRVMFRHLLPNAAAPIIVNATLIVGGTILTEAALSFLGYGVQPPDPSWGTIIQGGQEVLNDAWWIATVPGLAIVFTVVSFNLLGDALRDALDPRMKT
jgi:peptide/nickel transport system permease protein